MRAKTVGRIGLWILAVLVLLITCFHFVYRPWNLRWGATDEEVARSMVGDDLIENAAFNATRAITISAPPEDVWPWIVQMGYKRAGFYSYDFMDNAGIPSTERIIPELQDVKVGDLIPLSRAGGVTVKLLEPGRHLLLATESDLLTWEWDLRPVGSTQTRVVTRVRAGMPDFGMKLMWEAGEIWMMRKCLKGIKRRAESETANR